MKIRSVVMFSLSALASMVISQPVKAERVCQVTDPTGTPLNVRDSPNGEIINALRNGREVYIHKKTYDAQGRPWVLVGGYYEGIYKTWGWVFREFVSCYNR
ncbi:MAG: peptide-binding protein [Oscillatoriales cyanobacterium CG2_30_44_21]|nr:MAG: peptide-binding protein [Oscillatoriales cyanobacterium CG2_30_44_21]